MQTPQGEVGRSHRGDEDAGQVAAFWARLQALQGKGEIKIREKIKKLHTHTQKERKRRRTEPRPLELRRASLCLHFTPVLVVEGRWD